MPQPRISAAKAARARERFDKGEAVAAIGKDLGLSPKAFRAWRAKKNWPERPPRARAAPPPETPPAAEPPPPAEPPPAPDDDAPVDIAALRRRLERAVEAELASVGTRLSGANVAAGERNARLLASLVKTFAELRRLEALEPAPSRPGAAHDDERPPRDLRVLRHELARTVERLARERGGG